MDVMDIGTVKESTLRQILQTITTFGYRTVYPHMFDRYLNVAMDTARGSRFENVPKKYPKSAWYTDKDKKCDYACQLDGYLYWGVISNMSAKDRVSLYQKLPFNTNFANYSLNIIINTIFKV